MRKKKRAAALAAIVLLAAAGCGKEAEEDSRIEAGIIDKVKEKEIPVIFFNREPVEADMQIYEQAYYIGSDARESAKMQAEMYALLLGRLPGTDGARRRHTG